MINRLSPLFAALFGFFIFYSVPANAQQGITPCTPANTISVSNSSTNIQLSACGPTVLLWNIGTQEAFFKYGSSSSQVATTNDWSLPGNSFIVLNLGTSQLYLAAITASSTTTIRVIQGQTR